MVNLQGMTPLASRVRPGNPGTSGSPNNHHPLQRILTCRLTSPYAGMVSCGMQIDGVNPVNQYIVGRAVLQSMDVFSRMRGLCGTLLAAGT